MTPAERRQRIIARTSGPQLTLRELAAAADSDVWPLPPPSAEPEPVPEVEIERAPMARQGARRIGPKRGTQRERLVGAWDAEPPAESAQAFWRNLGESLHLPATKTRQRASNAGLQAKVAGVEVA